MSEPLLRMSNICKRYPGVKAVDDVSIDLQAGEVLGLMGENGAGKSTLIKMLAGAENRDSGKIYIEGKEVNIDSPKTSQDNGVSVIYQELITMDTLSVAENIFVGDLPTKKGLVDWKTARIKASEVLKRLNSDIDPKKIVDTLSIYEKQIVEIAKAIHKNAKVLVMDEPTAALSEKDAKSLFQMIETLRKQGVGIIYISHRIEEVFELTDRITVMRDGKYIGTEPTKSTKQEKIISMMIGRELNQLFPEMKADLGEVVMEIRDLNIKGIIENINFNVRKGEILGLFGLVGSGCLNIAKAIYGIDDIDRGEIFIDNKKVTIKKPKQALDNKIGFIPIDRKSEGLTLDFSVKRNLTLANITGLGSGVTIQKSKEAAIAEKWVKEMNIKTPTIETEVNNLSGGNQQKIVLGKTLETSPKVFVIVEPTRGIDVGAKMDIYQMMGKLCEEGASIIMISSEMPEMLALANRILVVSNGKIRKEFKKGETNQHELLHEATLN
jgi:ABC-type sugar transport system ATPase subunit